MIRSTTRSFVPSTVSLPSLRWGANALRCSSAASTISSAILRHWADSSRACSAASTDDERSGALGERRGRNDVVPVRHRCERERMPSIARIAAGNQQHPLALGLAEKKRADGTEEALRADAHGKSARVKIERA